MRNLTTTAKDRILIFSLGFLKLFIHVLTSTNYHLHRDEYLYFDEGKHLDWGFMEVPPVTPFLGKLADLLGGSVFAIRLFPALIGSLTIILAGFLVKRLGGKTWAILFCCLGLLFSPALLNTNSLLQPVSFNQFFWFLTAYVLLLYVQTQKASYAYLFGLSLALGFLTKYSIIFYALGLLLGILLTPERKLLRQKEPYIALGMALLIALPNLLWQYQHNFPILAHMEELAESQLVHVNWGDFIGSQFLFHVSLSVIWIAGLITLFTISRLKAYRFIGIAWLSTLLLIGFLHGKAYYTIGAFTILFPVGAIGIEHAFKKNTGKFVLLMLIILPILPALPYALPILSIDKMKKYATYMSQYEGFDTQLKWEDGKYYDLPQDYADMQGWEELSQRVADFYYSLTPEQQSQTMIYAGSYGHASSLNYFQDKYKLPDIQGLNGSHMIWAKRNVDFKYQIMIEEEKQHTSTWFEEMTVVDSIHNPYAREKGYIHFRQNPKLDVVNAWKELVEEQKSEFNFP